MTVYVDGISVYPSEMITTPAARHGNRWSHMFADDIGELHLFARGIGLKREYFQDKPIFPHYDVTPSKRNQAILRGAKIKEVITFLREKRDANKEHQVKQL